MKKINAFIAILAIWLIAVSAFAQQQNDPTPLGSGGQKIFCNSNEALSDTVTADGRLNFIACDKKGRLLSSPASVGSAVSVSGATGLYGMPSVPVSFTSIGADLVEAASTATVINATAHVARVGDILYLTGGTAGNIGVWSDVTAVATNTITLGHALPATPATNDAFEIRRAIPTNGGRIYNGTIDMTGGSNVFRFSCDGMSGGLFQVQTSTATSSLRVQVSADNSNFNTVNLWAIGATPASSVSSVSAGTLSENWFSCQGAPYAQIAISGGAGANTASFVLSLQPSSSVQRIAEIVPGVGLVDLGKTANTAAADIKATGATGALLLGVQNASYGTMSDSGGNYTALSLTAKGAVNVNVDRQNQSSQTTGILKVEDTASQDADALVGIGVVYQTTPAQSAGTVGDYSWLQNNDIGALYVEPFRRTTVNKTNPSIASASSVTLAGSNTARRFITIQNNSAANVCFSMSGAALTGIVPSGTNICDVLTPGSFYSSPVNYGPTGAITIYQTSGGTITSISVTEGS